MDVHPKYLKIKKAELIRRLVNAARAFIDGLINAQGFLLNAPINALEAFYEKDVEVIDKRKMLRDAQEEAEEDEEDNVITLKIQEKEEEWQKKHREIYEEENDD